jgi:6,7-dimethyl-8-ribityllumazine synthase
MADAIQVFEGGYAPPKQARFAVVAARFNEAIVEHLIRGALDALKRHGVPDANVLLVKVPGAYELPWACRRVVAGQKVDAVIALGCVIRGATPHFDYVAGEAAKGCGTVAMSTGVPVVFGVLTTNTIEQAVERAGTKAGNKGADAALAAIELVNLGRALGGGAATD